MSSMMEYKGYHASIKYDSDDNIFVGEVFGIRDSLNFHGSSVNELREMFEQSIDNYMEICRVIGKEPDKEFKGTFNVRISPELHKKVAFAAAQQEITLNQYVVKALEQSFEEAKETIREVVTQVTYIPYERDTADWPIEKNSNFFSSFVETPILNKKEDFMYVRS